MGRPLNKKYFGNRNIGVGGNQTTDHSNPDAINGDDGIGGSSISNVAFSAAVLNTSYGTGKYLDRKPTMTLPAPTIANGVQAVGSVTNVQAVAAQPNNKGTGYQIGDIVVGTTGTGTKARFRVTKVRVLSVAISNQAASGQFDGGENLVWDSLVDDNWTSPTILRTVTSTGSPNYDLGATSTPYNVGTSTFGVWDGYVGGVQALAPTSLTITGGGNGFNTRGNGDTNGPTQPGLDNNGAGGTATFTYGIEAVEVVDGYQGNYTIVDGSAQAVTNVSGSGSNATLDIWYGVKTVTITEPGSGYTGAEAVTFSTTSDGSEIRATGTLTLVADSGAVGSATNQENAIVAFAMLYGYEEVDIIRQVSTDRYRINSNSTSNTDAGFRNGRLVANKVANAGFSTTSNVLETEMNIWAFDSEGKSYLVKKLTARKAVVYPFACARLSKSAGTQFTAGSSVPWKFFEGTTADSGYVKIENA